MPEVPARLPAFTQLAAALSAAQVGQEAGLWRQGLDVHSHVEVPLWDAVLGGTAAVQTLRGGATLPIPPGTAHGAVLSLARAGVQVEGGAAAACGAHHFRVALQLPRQVSDAERSLLQRLAELQRSRRSAGTNA